MTMVWIPHCKYFKSDERKTLRVRGYQLRPLLKLYDLNLTVKSFD